MKHVHIEITQTLNNHNHTSRNSDDNNGIATKLGDEVMKNSKERKKKKKKKDGITMFGRIKLAVVGLGLRQYRLR